MYFNSPAKIAAYLFLLLTCGYAFWRGEKPERWAAVLIALDWIATPLVQNHDAFRSMQIAMFILDGSLSLALLYLALTTNRFWPIWVAAFQFLELLMHMAMLIDPRVRPRAYYVGMEIWSYFMLIALVVGAWLEAPKPSTKRLSA